MTSTIDAIIENQNRKDNLIFPAEFADMAFIDRPFTLREGKLLHLLLNNAGKDICSGNQHMLETTDINEKFKIGGSCLLSCATGLASKQVSVGKALQDEGSMGLLIRNVGFISAESSAVGRLEYCLTDFAMRVIEESKRWGLMSRKNVISRESRYALRLYEMMAHRVSFELVKSETFAVPVLRKMLGVADKKCLQWSDLRTVVIEPAIKGMQGAVSKSIRYEPVKRRRTIGSIKFDWAKKKL